MTSNLRLSIVTALGLMALSPPPAVQAWSFGVMSDTQWKSSINNVLTTGGQNTVATGIIDSLNQQFINAKVDFVVQVGDLTDDGSSVAMQTRASSAQALYDAGIGFMPLRGNHESSSASAVLFQSVYPQTQGLGSSTLTGASNFSSPSAMPGLSYSFDYKGASFVMLDQFSRPQAPTSQSVLGQDQVDWVSGVLNAKADNTHAFVFAHKGLITENHTDTLFGANPAAAPALQNQFMSALAGNDVRYFFGGHDHMHNRAVVTSPDGLSSVQDITTSSNSYKFYVPQTGANVNDVKYNSPPRETPIAQELFTIGYYIVNVDGPRVTVDYFSSPNGCNGDCDLTALPANLTYNKQETFGYSLNGKEFLIKPFETLTGVRDSSPKGGGYLGTDAAILAGMNAVNPTVYDKRMVSQDINTGWTSRTESGGNLKSDILSLWGMANQLGSDKTDTYVLSLTFDPTGLTDLELSSGNIFLMTKDATGNWINAVDLNFGGTETFVLGSYDAAYGLGTYGVNPFDHTAWAVLNHASDFAVGAVPLPGGVVLFLSALAGLGTFSRRAGALGRQ